MTDEQIKQNAENIVNALTIRPEACIYSRSNMISAAIAGAHSRDEEIERIKNEATAIMDEACALTAELNKLRNPWISVEDRLPKAGDIVLTRTVLIIEGGGERNESVQYHEQRYIGRWITDRMEQHRMGGILFDTIDKVTHWMQIPQIEKGE